jgi:murein DD-endopeptidase MepM/ murein hydrolase activator NlpD
MATYTPHSKSRVALRGLAITVATLCLYPCSPTTTPATASTTTGERPTSSYGWPIKPFHSQHPVRGFFGDPRVDWEIPNVRRMYRFHFGIDVSAPDGTAVYATASGRITVQSEAVVVTRGDGVDLEYWHVVPTVRTGDRATAYRTVVGRIAHGWGHVHFSERRAGAYVNPLRPGAL